MSGRILLRRDEEGDSWFAEYFGEDGEEIERIFGTRILPTCFKACAREELVVETISRLNPGYEIEVER